MIAFGDGSQLLHLGAQWIGLLIDLNIKGSLLILAIWALALTQRHVAASLRHLLWAAVFVIVPVIPLIPHLPVPFFGDFATSLLSSLPALPHLTLTDPALFAEGAFAIALVAAFAIWFLGAAALAIRYLFGLAIARWFSVRHVSGFSHGREELFQEIRRSLGIRRPVRLLANDRVGVPMTAGTFAPVVVLPVAACDWKEARFAAVVTHELAHVKRWDYATKFLSIAVRSVCWFNPLFWIAARQLHEEMEQSCDDMVLAHGVRASDYALHLMDLARSIPRRFSLGAGALGLAARIGLKHRLEIILNPGTNRAPATAWRLLSLGAALLLVLLPVAALRTRREPAPANTGTSSVASYPLPDRVPPRAANNPVESFLNGLQLNFEPPASGPRESLTSPIVLPQTRERVILAEESTAPPLTGGGAESPTLRRLLPAPDDTNERLGGSAIISFYEVP